MSHYVYVAFDADRRPLYVGCTNDVQRRMKEHRAYGIWTDKLAHLDVLAFDTVEEALLVERTRIAKLRPRHNRRDNPRYVSVAVAVARQEWFEEFDRLNGGAA